MSPTHPLAAAVALAVVATGLAACGSSSSSSAATVSRASTASTAPAGAAAPAKPSSTVAATGAKVTVDTTEYAFAPAAITAKAGKVSFTLDNRGKIPHELIVLRTGADPAALKVDAKTSRVSESSSVGEVSETAAGKTRTTTLDLKAGRYVFVCNIPAHYKLGMSGVLTVT